MANRSDAEQHKIELNAAEKTKFSLVNLLVRMGVSSDKKAREQLYGKYGNEMAESGAKENFKEEYTGKAWQNLALLNYIKKKVVRGEILDPKTLEFRSVEGVKAESKKERRALTEKKKSVAGEVMDQAAKDAIEVNETFAENLTPAEILELSGFEVVNKGKTVAWIFKGLNTPNGKVNSRRGFLLTKKILAEINRKENGELVYDNKNKVTLLVYKWLWEKIYHSGRVENKYHVKAFKQSQEFLKSEIARLQMVVNERSGRVAGPDAAAKPVRGHIDQSKRAESHGKSTPVEPVKPAPAVPAEPVKPSPAAPVQPVEPRSAPEVVRQKETVAWNKDILLTFDDSLQNSLDIIEHLERSGVKEYRFFAEFATALKPDVLKDMGVFKNKRSDKITPGKWLTEYIDLKRGGMSRTEYIRKYMIKDGSNEKMTNYVGMGDKIREKFKKLYPGNWMDKLQETFAYHAAILHPINSGDRKNHIQFWNADQIKEDILTFEEFMKAWLGVPEFKVRYLRPPVGGGFGFDTAWGGSGKTNNAQKMIDVVKSFRPDAQWQLWNVDSGDTRLHGRKVDSADVARRAVANVGRAPLRSYEPEKRTVLLMHAANFGGKKGGNLDTLVNEIDVKYKEKKKEKAEGQNGSANKAPEVIKQTGKIPPVEEISRGLEGIQEKYRHYFTEEDKRFVNETIGKFKPGLVDQNKDQYLVVVDRAKQFAAVVYFAISDHQYHLVGNFGSMTSTGKQKPSADSWATPLGVYNLKPFYEQREASGKEKWRTEGTGHAGFGPRGSRVFHLGYVDVNSPKGKNASIAMHKTSRSGQSLLGRTSASHGCIRVADGFIDLLDKKDIFDSKFGYHVIVGDSSTNNQPKYSDVDHGRRESKQ